MSLRLAGWARELLEGPRRFATLATIAPDGSPHQAVVWYTLVDDAVLVNSAVGRRWPTNLQRDPRFSLVVEDGYRWVGLRGSAEALADPERAQEDIAAMARRYHADEPERAERLIHGSFRRQERISFLLRATSINERPDE